MAGAEVKVGAIDIGTNSTRLLVADVTDGAVRWLEHRVVVTGLGRGVDATGVLAEESMVRTVEVLAGYRAAVDAAGVARARVVATSASRDAANRDEFFARAEAVLGFAPELITGDEEAALSFRGATGGLATAAPHLVVDPGGGSTEFVYGSGAPETLVSVDIGSVRLTERSLPHRPAPAADLLAAAGEVERLFAAVSLPGRPATAIGVGGTFTSLAAIAMELPVYDRLSVHGAVLDRDRLASLVADLSTLTVEETAAIPSLDPARAPVILAGSVIAEVAARIAGVDEIVVSEADILDGVALGLAEQGPAT